MNAGLAGTKDVFDVFGRVGSSFVSGHGVPPLLRLPKIFWRSHRNESQWVVVVSAGHGYYRGMFFRRYAYFTLIDTQATLEDTTPRRIGCVAIYRARCCKRSVGECQDLQRAEAVRTENPSCCPVKNPVSEGHLGLVSWDPPFQRGIQYPYRLRA